jgi:hypothetical protein
LGAALGRWIIIIILFLAGCAASPLPRPQPRQELEWVYHDTRGKDVLSPRFLVGDISDDTLELFKATFPNRFVSDKEWDYIVKQARAARINPVFLLAVFQKECAGLSGMGRPSMALCMGFARWNKKYRGFKNQIRAAAFCFRRHYDKAVKKKWSIIRLQDDDGTWRGYVAWLNPAEVAHYIYNPVKRGNVVLKKIRIKYQRKIIDILEKQIYTKY